MGEGSESIETTAEILNVVAHPDDEVFGAGMITDCQPNENVEALRVFMLNKKIEARPTWKPMHKQPVYAGAPVYTNGVEVELFKVGFCLPAGPYVTDDDVRYIVESIKEAIV